MTEVNRPPIGAMAARRYAKLASMLLASVTGLLYLLATFVLATSLLHRGGRPAATWLPLVLGALVLHALAHILSWRASGGTDMHFFAALSLVGLGMAALTALFGANGRTAALGVVVFPLAAIMLGAYAAYGRHTVEALDWRLQLHAWAALLSYATLAVAALLAVMLWLQERALRRHRIGPWLDALPPLVDLETLLFRTVGAGFVLLTVTLLTGVLFVQDLFAQHLVHKTVLSVLSWLLFGGLLLGRWRRGWRGRIAVRWTLAAMVLLVLAFFGSKAVLELVLHRVA